MLKKCLVISLLVLSVFILSSCQPSAPKAKYLNYEISQITADGIEINFHFEIDNPNPLPLDVSEYKYTIYINEKELISETRKGFSLPASNKKKIIIPVKLKHAQVYESILSVLDKISKGEKSIAYRIEGHIIAGTMGLNSKSPIKASGKIPIPKDFKL